MPVERRGRVTRVGIDGSTGHRRSPLVSAEDGSLQRGGTSRMNREVQVRFCEGLEVKLLGSTRQGGLLELN